MNTPATPPTAKEIAQVKRLVKRAKKLFEDLEDNKYVMTFVTGGGQPHAILHPEDVTVEQDSNYHKRPGIYDIGPTGVGEMIAL